MSDDAIRKFVDVTGSSVEQAINYLSICDNNVSLAVECFVDQQPQTNGPSSNGTGSSMSEEEHVRAPIPSRTDRLVEEHVRVGRVSKRPANAFDLTPGQRDFTSSHYTNPLAKRKLNGMVKYDFYCHYCSSLLIKFQSYFTVIFPVVFYLQA